MMECKFCSKEVEKLNVAGSCSACYHDGSSPRIRTPLSQGVADSIIKSGNYITGIPHKIAYPQQHSADRTNYDI